MNGRYKAYGEYKESGVEWLGEIPREWSALMGKRIFSSIRKTALKDDVQLAVSQKYGVLPQSLMMLLNDSKVMLALKGTDSFRHVDQNDFVISLRSFEGGIEYSKYSGCVSPAYTVLNNVKKISHNYYKYLLKCAPFISALQSTTDSLRDGKSISYEQFGAICLPLTRLSEQNQIAAFLDHETAKIDTLIDKQQQLIELLIEKRQAVISHAVTKGLDPDVQMKDSGVEWLGEVPEHWKVIYIKHLSEVKRGASPRPIDDQKYFDEEGEYAWTRIADVSLAGMYLKDTQQRLSSLGSSLSVKLERGELFLSIAGTVGKPCITTSKACIHDGFVYFPSLKINNKYLFYIFDAGQAYLGLGKMGTQLNLNTDTVGCIKVGLPPSLEIHEIVSYIVKQKEKYDLLISSAYEFIELIQERRTALISAAVTGKIDVRDWQVPVTQTESDEVMA